MARRRLPVSLDSQRKLAYVLPMRSAVAVLSMFAVSLLLAAATPVAHARESTGVRLTGKTVLLGVLGGRERFDQLTGQQTRVGHVIAGWGQGPVSNILEALGEIPMLGVRTDASLSAHDVAFGRGDDWLAQINQAVASRQGLVYIRPFPEMNGHWNDYCAYNQDGSSRGVARSAAALKKAFARVYLLVHGGPLGAVNARLRRLGLPATRVSELATNPLSRVRVVWNPQGYGSPDIPGNSAAAYYPGDAYVDVVANDLYNIRGSAAWDANDQLYAAHPNKPYAIAEWANWGFDDPAFIARMAAFVRTHRVQLVAYYNGRPGSPWDIAAQPRSRTAYRRLIVPLGK
jgi:glycosyl hydrolase family 26